MQVAAPGVDELWLATLQRLASRAAHEIKGALNGVSVNLEVVRSRAARPEAPAALVSGFAENAAGQLDAVVRMNEALLALARAPREPVELGTVLRHLAVLLVPAAKAEGFAFELRNESDGDAVPLAAGGNLPRLVVGAAMLAALDARTDIACDVSAGESAVIAISAGDTAPALPPDVARAAADAGITVRNEDGRLTLEFPRATD